MFYKINKVGRFKNKCNNVVTSGMTILQYCGNAKVIQNVLTTDLL